VPSSVSRIRISAKRRWRALSRRRPSELRRAIFFSHCREALDQNKMPVSVMFVSEIPRSDLAKIKRYVLREQIESVRASARETTFCGSVRAVAGRRRGDLIVAEVRRLVTNILNLAPRTPLPALDNQVSFGQFGLKSLGAVRLANSLSQLLGRPCAGNYYVMGGQTISALADYVSTVIGADAAQEVPAEPAPRPMGADRQMLSGPVIGIGCRFREASRHPNSFGKYWRWAAMSRPTFRRIAGAWVPWYDPARGVPGKAYARRVAFLSRYGNVFVLQRGFPCDETAEARSDYQCGQPVRDRCSDPIRFSEEGERAEKGERVGERSSQRSHSW
jgi:hypothetical protein